VCAEVWTVLRAVAADFFSNYWYLISLLFVESFNLHMSNQYILVRVIPSCFHFMKMCLSQMSPVKV
jgi:hypothetical protein